MHFTSITLYIHLCASKPFWWYSLIMMERDWAVSSNNSTELLCGVCPGQVSLEKKWKCHNHYHQNDCEKFILRACLINANYTVLHTPGKTRGTTLPRYHVTTLPRSLHFLCLAIVLIINNLSLPGFTGNQWHSGVRLFL